MSPFFLELDKHIHSTTLSCSVDEIPQDKFSVDGSFTCEYGALPAHLSRKELNTKSENKNRLNKFNIYCSDKYYLRKIIPI